MSYKNWPTGSGSICSETFLKKGISRQEAISLSRLTQSFTVELGRMGGREENGLCTPLTEI